MVDYGTNGWDVPETRDAVFRGSKERAEFVRADAMERARRIADLPKTRCSASAVTLYGSLAEGRFHDKSDIDILVEGFTGGYWEMYVAADEMAALCVSLLIQRRSQRHRNHQTRWRRPPRTRMQSLPLPG